MNSKIEHAFIPAAGFGSRLMPITKHIPKCMVHIDKKPVIDYAINKLSNLKQIKKIFINTHHLADKVSEFLAEHESENKINIVHEEMILGTGGAIKNICLRGKHKEMSLLVHNADAFFYGEDFIEDFINKYDGQEFFLAIMPKKLLQFDEQGDFDLDANGKLIFTNGGEYIYTGLAILKTGHFANWKESFFSITEVIKMYEPLVGYYIIPSESKWIDIGTPQKLEYIQEISTQQRQKNL